MIHGTILKCCCILGIHHTQGYRLCCCQTNARVILDNGALIFVCGHQPGFCEYKAQGRSLESEHAQSTCRGISKEGLAPLYGSGKGGELNPKSVLDLPEAILNCFPTLDAAAKAPASNLAVSKPSCDVGSMDTGSCLLAVSANLSFHPCAVLVGRGLLLSQCLGCGNISLCCMYNQHPKSHTFCSSPVS
jgi:hypothetical protein